MEMKLRAERKKGVRACLVVREENLLAICSVIESRPREHRELWTSGDRSRHDERPATGSVVLVAIVGGVRHKNGSAQIKSQVQRNYSNNAQGSLAWRWRSECSPATMEAKSRGEGGSSVSTKVPRNLHRH